MLSVPTASTPISSIVQLVSAIKRPRRPPIASPTVAAM
jgi:hypothetical protein